MVLQYSSTLHGHHVLPYHAKLSTVHGAWPGGCSDGCAALHGSLGEAVTGADLGGSSICSKSSLHSRTQFCTCIIIIDDLSGGPNTQNLTPNIFSQRIFIYQGVPVATGFFLFVFFSKMFLP